MARRMVIAAFEELVLRAVHNEGADAYGVPIRKRLEAITGKEVSVGALYTTLGRLEEKGYISSRMGEKTEARGGRAKKYFKVEGAGYSALAEAQKVRDSADVASSWLPGVVHGEGMAY